MKLRKMAFLCLILASMFIGVNQNIQRTVPLAILPKDSDEREILTQKKFNVKIYRNDAPPTVVRDSEIAKIFRLSNESLNILLPGMSPSTDAVIFVPDSQRKDFMEADGGKENDLGMHMPEQHIMVVSRQSFIETLGTLNHERIHCMFHTDNESFARLGEYLLTMDQALSTNNALWAKNADNDWRSYLDNRPELQLDPFLMLVFRYKNDEWPTLADMFRSGAGVFANYGWAGNMSLDYENILQQAATKVFRSHKSRYVRRCAVDPYHCVYFDFAPDERDAFIRRTRPTLASQVTDGIGRD